LVSRDGLMLERGGVNYLSYDGQLLKINITDETLTHVSFHSERNLLERIVGPETELNKFCKVSKDRGYAPPLMMVVCLGDMTEMLLGIVPRFFSYLLGDIAGLIIGFWADLGILVVLIWQIGKNARPVAYISLSLLFIWILLSILRVWPDILF